MLPSLGAAAEQIPPCVEGNPHWASTAAPKPGQHGQGWFWWILLGTGMSAEKHTVLFLFFFFFNEWPDFF